MFEETDIKKVIAEPHLLIDFTQKVIDQLKSKHQNLDIFQIETQLREINSAIQRMEKKGVTIPSSLREEKIQLNSKLSNLNESTKALNALLIGFQKLINQIENRATPFKKAQNQRARTNKSKLQTTHPSVLREYLLKALNKLGGRASSKEVIEEMGNMLKGKLQKDDLVWRNATYDYAWQNSAKWERYYLTKEGILRSDSPRGIWELSENIK